MLLTRLVLYGILIFFVLRATWRFFTAIAQGMGAQRPEARTRSEGGVHMVRDPVCGTFVVPGNAVAVRDGTGVHHFCSDKCRDAFVARAKR